MRSASRPSSPASRPAYSLVARASALTARGAQGSGASGCGPWWPSGSWALMRPPPAARASSSAARASWTSSSWLPAFWGKEATPPDTLIVVPDAACAANVAASRLTSVVADSALIPGSTSANESPPIRQTQSYERTPREKHSAASRRTRSPSAWLCTLCRASPSMSTTDTARLAPVRFARASSRASTPANPWRLGRPVSASSVPAAAAPCESQSRAACTACAATAATRRPRSTASSSPAASTTRHPRTRLALTIGITVRPSSTATSASASGSDGGPSPCASSSAEPSSDST